jgi:hypothetical protein
MCLSQGVHDQQATALKPFSFGPSVQWLGIILGTRLWYGFYGATLDDEQSFEGKVDELTREVGKLGRGGLVSPPADNATPAAAPAELPAAPTAPAALAHTQVLKPAALGAFPAARISATPAGAPPHPAPTLVAAAGSEARDEVVSAMQIGALVARLERLLAGGVLPTMEAEAALDAVADYVELPPPMRRALDALGPSTTLEFARHIGIMEAVQTMVRLSEAFDGDATFARQLRRKGLSRLR